MSKEATFQVRMDLELKEQVERLYKRLGTSFAEAVRMFARQSLEENAMPFILHVPARSELRYLNTFEGQSVNVENYLANNTSARKI